MSDADGLDAQAAARLASPLAGTCRASANCVGVRYCVTALMFPPTRNATLPLSSHDAKTLKLQIVTSERGSQEATSGKSSVERQIAHPRRPRLHRGSSTL
jgi:hypothetical protein